MVLSEEPKPFNPFVSRSVTEKTLAEQETSVQYVEEIIPIREEATRRPTAEPVAPSPEVEPQPTFTPRHKQHKHIDYLYRQYAHAPSGKKGRRRKAALIMQIEAHRLNQ